MYKKIYKWCVVGKEEIKLFCIFNHLTMFFRSKRRVFKVGACTLSISVLHILLLMNPQFTIYRTFSLITQGIAGECAW